MSDAARNLPPVKSRVPRVGGAGGRPRGYPKTGGRKAGQPNKRTIDTRKELDELIYHSGGKSPLRVMIENMRYFDSEAIKLEERIYAHLSRNRPERALKAYERMITNMMKAQECAKQAAPYCHPQLSSIDFQATVDQNIRAAVVVQFVDEGEKAPTTVDITPQKE